MNEADPRNVYAESSAVLAWLLGESPADEVRVALEEAPLVIASDLTLVEVDRALIRLGREGDLPEARAAERRATFHEEAAHWLVLRLDGEVIERARRPFPAEPIRTLDALHLASALLAQAVVAPLAVLSLDQRVRRAARGLGCRLLPAEGPR